MYAILIRFSHNGVGYNNLQQNLAAADARRGPNTMDSDGRGDGRPLLNVPRINDDEEDSNYH